MQSDSSLFEALFKRKPTDPGSKVYLQHLADRFPFYTPAQFYLLQQKDQYSEDYNEQAAKTSVLFNNSYWLNFLLIKSKQPVDENSDIAFRKEQPVTVAQHIDQPKEEPVNVTENIVQPKEEPIKTEEPIANNAPDEELLFEPLYTTDYFASQGIKLSEEVQPTDKLGKQLKSFTDWLKTMKKISPDKLTVDLNAQTDTAVQTLAERSNTEDEVLTEAMAEVLTQQGKKEKAIEVYQKLSLLNPSKMTYFAAKIEQLKEQ